MITQALILAGGLGTRLGDLTRQVPKPMVPVGDKPFLERLLLHLQHQGLTRFVICTGYLGRQIEDYFGDGSKWNCEIVYSVEKELLGTGGAIKKAASLLEETFLVASGDNFLDFDYRDFMKTFERLKPMGLLACWKVTKPGFEPNLLLDEKTGRVLDYSYRDAAGKNFLDSGIKLFSKKILSHFPPQEKFSLEADVMEKMAREGLLAGYPIPDHALDVGTPEGLAHVRSRLVNR